MTFHNWIFFSLHLKEEAHDYLEPKTLKDLVHKYSQFINFNIYLWTSKVSIFNICFDFWLMIFCFTDGNGRRTNRWWTKGRTGKENGRDRRRSESRRRKRRETEDEESGKDYVGLGNRQRYETDLDEEVSRFLWPFLLRNLFDDFLGLPKSQRKTTVNSTNRSRKNLILQWHTRILRPKVKWPSNQFSSFQNGRLSICSIITGRRWIMSR